MTHPTDFYWHFKQESSSELLQICSWAIDQATTGKELAAAARLVVGARLVDTLGADLRARIDERVRELHAKRDPDLVLTHADGIGKALQLLNDSSPRARDET